MEEVAGKIIEGSKGYGGDTYLATIIVVAAAAACILWIIYVQIPNSKSSRESNAKLADATYALSQVTADTYKLTGKIDEKAKGLGDSITSLINCTDAGIRAMEKLSEATKVNIASELGEMKGALMRHKN